VFIFLRRWIGWSGRIAKRHEMIVTSSWATLMPNTKRGTRTRGLAGCVFLIVMARGCPSFAIGMACECTLQWGVRFGILAPLICLSGNRQQGFHMMGRLALNMSPLSRGLKWISQSIWLGDDHPGGTFRHLVVMKYWNTLILEVMRRYGQG